MGESLKQLLIQQWTDYPLAQPVDLLKLLYQNEFGCGHLIANPVESMRRLAEEAAEASRERTPKDAVEPIGNGLCRLHLSALWREGLSLETFHRFFELSAVRLRGGMDGFLQKAAVLESLCRDQALPFSGAEIRGAMEAWRENGCHPFRHSQVFRDGYHPAYRVVEGQFCDFLSLFCRIDNLAERKTPVLAAIDGDCAAGKTTLASLLRLVYGCNVLPMDHFFLRPEQQTAERLSEPGGNVDWERFQQQVLIPLQSGRPFCYRPYDCSRRALGEELCIKPHPIAIAEGSYSLHPKLRNAYHLKAFLSVGSEEQRRRIRIRNGKEQAKRFENEWIPMEKVYFSTFQVEAQCDLRFVTG